MDPIEFQAVKNGYRLDPLETITRLVKSPNFLTFPNNTFAEYMTTNIIRASAVNSSISADVTVEIAQAQMGVALFRQQKKTSRLLAGFVYKMLVPDMKVPKDMKFRRRYKITDQREAQQGTYDTISNGVQTKEYCQVFKPDSRFITMQFGSLLDVTVPSLATELIRREFDRVSTCWEITRSIAVLKYCAAQPTLTDRVMQRTRTSSLAEKLDCVLVMAELMCGMVNIQPDSFLCALENARRVLGSDKPEVIIMGDSLFSIISQRGSNGNTWSHIVSEDTSLTPEFSVYTIDNEKAGSGPNYDFTMRQVSQHALGDSSLPFINESCFRDKSIDMKVNYLRVGGGTVDKIPIAHVDGVQMEHGSIRDSSTECKAFCNSDGFKWEYFTVGCMAPALNQINPSHVLSTSDSDDINYKQLAQRSPSVSYLHQYDGTVVPVSLRSLHPIGNPKELFSRDHRLRLQNDVNALMRSESDAVPVEALARLGLSADWYSKIKNPASVLEFDTRNMVVPRPVNDGEREDATSYRWVVRPRVALFNSSSMNNISNEIAQIGSELLTHFGDTEHAKRVGDNLLFLDRALHYESGIHSMLAMRHGILQSGKIDGLVEGWTKGRTYWSWLADPICAVSIRRHLADKETQGIDPEERTVLVQLEGLMNGMIALFKSIVGHRNNSVIASLPAFISVGSQSLTPYGYPTIFTLEDVDFCNLMYWIILPVLGARVYCFENGPCIPVCTLISYRRGDVNLTNELNLDNENNLTVTCLPENCAFSKVTPQNGIDVCEMFEPTASAHKLCTDPGFSDTSLITYMWAIRLRQLAGISNNVAKVLMGIHYSTLLTHGVIRDHYDTKYYSGMAYLLFRGVRFTGCGISLMQQKSALYTLGNNITCAPTAHNTHNVKTLNQYSQYAVMPETLESPGVYIPNLYMKDIRGGDVHINRDSPFDMVVADAFNGFCPESDSASGYRRPYIFTTGRSERLNGSVTQDPMMRVEAYTCMPTLLHPFSSVLRIKNKHSNRHRRDEVSNHRHFCNALHMIEFEKSVLNAIGDPFKDTVDRVNGDKRTTDIMESSLGVSFCGTYSIGLTSDKKLMCLSDETRETLLDRLAPRISGTGIFACNPIHTTSLLINPIFNRIFDNTRYSRFLL